MPIPLNTSVRDVETGRAAHGVLRAALASVLVVAAALKAYGLATDGASIGLQRWLLLAVVEAELVLAALLATGLAARRVHYTALAAFGVFAAVSGYKALRGESSCGCFGPLALNPWVTFALDVSAVGALLCVPPPVETTVSRRAGLAMGAAILIAAFAAPVFIVRGGPTRVAGEGELASAGGVVILEPQSWVGKRFPLGRYIDIGSELSSGRWTVVLYRHDCPDCLRALPVYESRARDLAAERSEERVALIQVPPLTEEAPPVTLPTSCALGSLESSKSWFVETPAVISLQDGVVVDARHGREDTENAAEVEGDAGTSNRSIASRDVH